LAVVLGVLVIPQLLAEKMADLVAAQPQIMPTTILAVPELMDRVIEEAYNMHPRVPPAAAVVPAVQG
jgi:hypothetical protein